MIPFFTRVIQDTFKACSNFASYRTLIARGPNQAFLHFLCITLVAAGVFTTTHYRAITRMVKTIVPLIETHIPPFNIVDGELQCSIEKAATVTYGGFAFILDPQGEVQNIPDSVHNGVIMQKRQLIVKRDIVTSKPILLKDMFAGNVVFNPKGLTGKLRRYQPILLPLLLVFHIVFILVTRLIFVLVALPFSMIVQGNRGLELPSSENLNLLLYTLNPPMMLAIVAALFGLRIPYATLLYICLQLTFVWGALDGMAKQIFSVERKA